MSTESYDEFLNSLKRLGIKISNELELRERMAEETRRWRAAFATLVSNGQSLGIRFEKTNSDGNSEAAIRSTLSRFAFPEPAQETVTTALRNSALIQIHPNKKPALSRFFIACSAAVRLCSDYFPCTR